MTKGLLQIGNEKNLQSKGRNKDLKEKLDALGLKVMTYFVNVCLYVWFFLF